MVKSKIPLPSKRPAQSSIPLPIKCLDAQSKKLPLNSKEALVSKKPVVVKQVQSISSKASKEKENIVQRLPSSKSYDSKKEVVLTKPSFNGKKVADVNRRLTTENKPSFNGKKVADVNRRLTTENKLLKQTKPAPGAAPKILVSKASSVNRKENQLTRFSSYKSQNVKTAVRSTNEQRTKTKVNEAKVSNKTSNNGMNENTNRKFSSCMSQKGKTAVRLINEQKVKTKSVTQSKVINEVKNSKEISKNKEENINRNLPKIKKNENVAVIAPLKQTNVVAKSGVDDSEFLRSGFFKSLILNERELSPGIISYCSKEKFSPSKANSLQLLPKASPRFLTADELVEEVKRTSSKYYRLNGRLVLRSPGILKHEERFAEGIIEEVKRLSGRYRQRNGNFNNTPLMTLKNIDRRFSKDVNSIKENLNLRQVDEVRRLSEFRRQTSLNVDALMANRRWTCNVPGKPSIANMNTSEIAAEIRRVSEIRRESGAQVYKKAPFLDYQNSVEKLNPRQRVLQELEFLTTKKKDKTKKKVTFLVPSSGSPDLTPELSKPEAKLSDISEGSSNNCTPELDLGNGRVTANSQSVHSAENVEDTSVITTPELNLSPYKHESHTANNHNETLPFDLPHKSDASTNNKSSINQAVSFETDISKKNTNQFSCDFPSNFTNLKPDFMSSKFSSLSVSENNITLQDMPDSNPTSFENCLTQANSYNEFSNLKSTDCLFQSAQNFAVPTNYQPVNETEEFSVKTEKQIYTPHPINLHSKSNLPPSVSPSFLSRKFTTLNSVAPIYTPYVLKTLSQSPEVNLSHVRQKLDFNERPSLFMERQESQIILQTIPTIQKMNDFLCDQECIILSSQCSDEEIFGRNLRNPIAFTFSNGDEMHFIPINSP